MKIVIASDNKGKAKEMGDILGAKGIEFVLQGELVVGSIPETGLTFVENAILKARNCCKKTKMPSIGDDSGLEVHAISNKPGVYSARFAGEPVDNNKNIAKLLLELKDVPERKRAARFCCVTVFLKDEFDPSPIICQGTWSGRIAFSPKGEKGFGYDPIFWVPEHNCMAAELEPEIKNKISHRAMAMEQLIISMKKELNL